MSCILFSLESYVKLASHPAFLAAFNNNLRTSYDDAQAFAVALFELNATAYRSRYSNGGDDELNSAVDAERENAAVDSEFAGFLTAHRYATPKAYAALWKLLKRVEYQCVDATDYNDIPAYWHLCWALDFAARQMAAAIENYNPPPPVHSLAGTLRLLLGRIARVAQESTDHDSADVIGRAVVEAQEAVDRIDGHRQQQPTAKAA